MKKTQETEPTSPLSDFADILSGIAPLETNAPKKSCFGDNLAIYKICNYARSSPLRPNCLLTRNPILFVLDEKTGPLERFATRWLIQQLKNHGYWLSNKKQKRVHLWTNSPQWLATLTHKSQSPNTEVLSVTGFGKQAIGREVTGSPQTPILNHLCANWYDPLDLLHQALGICKSLAETDYQCCDK